MSTSAVMTRRHFISLGKLEQHVPIRPPWSLSEEQFVMQCTQCGDCITACPENILLHENLSRYPKVDFSLGECTFCHACADACPTQALDKHLTQPWQMKITVGETCLAENKVICVICSEQCEVQAIRFPAIAGRVSLPEINMDSCTGCGACIAPCPVRALEVMYER